MDFNDAIELVLGHEGGYVNDSTDRGGETNWGISKRAYPNVDIKNLTREGAKEIYYNDYWCKGKCELLPEVLRYAHFDACVNSGIAGANKLLQAASGTIADGILGSNSLSAIEDLSLERYCMERLYKYCQIVRRNQSQAKYIGGWSLRVMDVYNHSS
tara:strand:+ start:699 stop:1169 length:471 start_codon:yes stop_codon:yes gene_type:complete